MIRRLRLTLRHALRSNLDLLILWLASVAAAPSVPAGSPLASDDLGPWLTAVLVAALLLRGAALGAGPHPMLNPRRSGLARLLRRAAAALTPAALWAIFEAGRGASPQMALGGGGGALLVLTLVSLGARDGETAWRPAGGLDALRGAVALIALGGGAAGLGRLLGALPDAAPATIASLLGLQFLGAGLVLGRGVHVRQRVAAGRRDGRPYRADLFPFLLALLGPGLGLFALHALFAPLGGLDFNQAFVGGLHVVVWVGLVWARPEPVAAVVLLHVVVPVGGEDAVATEAAPGFDEPPEGALRLNPLAMRRTRVIHPWLVPVRGSRIADLDDPVRPLWERAPAPLPHHVLGEARFEPDPVSRATQSEVVTLSLRGEDESVSLAGSGGQTRRIAILRPFLPPGAQRRPRTPTYAWDGPLPEESVQILDPTTDRATLRDGDVLVLSVEGVATALEVEIGAPLYSYSEAMAFRPPQLEDYVELGA